MEKPLAVRPGELLAETDADLVGSSVMISYSRKGLATRRSGRRSARGGGVTGQEMRDTHSTAACCLLLRLLLPLISLCSDKAFVKNIYDALAVDDRNIWVDWEVRRTH